MTTTISVSDDTFRRVDRAAQRLGVSHGELVALAVAKALDALEDDDTTEAINRATAGPATDHAFTDAAAAALGVDGER